MSDVPNPPPIPSPPQSPRPAAPPTFVGEIVPLTRPAAWPTVLGTLILVYAIMGILGNIYSIVSVIMAEQMLAGAGPMMQMQAEITARWKPFTIGAESVQALLKLVLVACGIAMLRRRPRAAMLGKIWAWLTILATIIFGFITYMILVETFDQTMAVASLPTTGPALAYARIGGIIGGTCGGLLPLLAPIALLVWLGVASVKAEIARWPATQRPM